MTSLFTAPEIHPDIQQPGQTLRSPASASSDEIIPVTRFLGECYAEFADDMDGALADYIPELARANPAHFGVALAAIDGHVHEIGDTNVPFTIQSVSKAFVFALALEFAGAERVGEIIGVEPSGEAFNSIRLRDDNRPFNPMVNAGAIACTGLIHQLDPTGARERITEMLSRFAGHNLTSDDMVFQSERETGDRNRAIAWLLRNNGVIRGDVDEVLDTYFYQCSINVTARDLAIMGATLAANGVNPITGKTVISPTTIARTLSVMVSTGMYNYAGEWIYRVGLPAKSGVGGGIVATLPAQLGLGTFSPLLDAHGNSVRGLKVCERLSSHFSLHLLERSGDVKSNVIADYDVSQVTSSRDRNQAERKILDNHGHTARVLELGGALNFVACDYISRIFADIDLPEIIVFGMRRVTRLSPAAARLLETQFSALTKAGVRVVIAGLNTEDASGQPLAAYLECEMGAETRRFSTLDEAVEWSEDQVVYLHGGYDQLRENVDLSAQALMNGLDESDLAAIRAKTEIRSYRSGERIVTAGDPSDSLFFLQTGMVSIKLPSGTQIATLGGGTCFGELALLSSDSTRTAHVIADTSCTCQYLSLEAYDQLRHNYPSAAEGILRNLASLLAERLRQSNSKIDALSRG